VERILTDNGKNYTSHVFRNAAASHRITVKRTRPYRPQTNGKAEAFNKILQNE
jgi:transposase InsO family protein